MEGNLIYKPQPMYPPMARAARIQGAVVLRAIISKAGTIENLVVVHGHPMLSAAAIEAVRQWRYRPYVLNGEPIEVETEITVKLAKLGVRIYEVPIVYHGRTYAEGKKISWTDGVAAVYHLVRYRFRD